MATMTTGSVVVPDVEMLATTLALDKCSDSTAEFNMQNDQRSGDQWRSSMAKDCFFGCQAIFGVVSFMFLDFHPWDEDPP